MTILGHRILILLAALCLSMASLSGCGTDPTPTVAKTQAVAPTEPPVTATMTVTTPSVAPPSPTPSVLLAATHTSQSSQAPEAATDTPRPSRTPRSTVTIAPATATAATGTWTATPGIELAVGPEFPPDVNPLTGLRVSDPAVLERCPLAIKVSNSPSEVRPQAGLDKADLVFEHYAEGGVTRLTAVFLGQTPTMVGSVRSGRLIDLEIPAMFKALFAYSGTSPGVGRKYAASDLWPDQLAGPGTAGAFYRRDLPKAFEHTLFVNPVALWTEAERRGISKRQDLRGMTFDSGPPPGGTSATDVSILYRSGTSQVQWIYDTSRERYYRWQGGAAHGEELTGAQLSAANVIVVGANHVETDILEDTWGGGHWSIEIQIWGEGPVSIFRNGQRYDGIWRRHDRHAVLSFWTADGSERIPLKPGNSWLQMVPLGFTGLVVSP